MNKPNKPDSLQHVGIELTALEIHEKEFATRMRGYDSDEVNEFLDRIIVDYQKFAVVIRDMQKQIDELNARAAHQRQQPSIPVQPPQFMQPSQPAQPPVTQPVQQRSMLPHFELEELLFRVRELEKQVFGRYRD
ncbi:DivIVA domain-containing protein [Paenibacillus sp. ACRRX]|uniref:DivIVA domain-containing protein n=1 Tax=unclassified Paenibacillus TaxID=185978 RepID=UPI001EF3E05E|nr:MULTISPECIES: DivIVA domain-containing protein [unclassified Paenibacillus]MCG7407335.1 DivIVA domain-containing protein [Paenibacillus sp. ACRRX]MDK8180561.1 DivIVA domain-containing protein [Paenibacillus sp. UMB4589-SE434]